MVWDPDVVGWREDSFATGWAATAVDYTKIDGDLAQIVVQGGETVGYIQKTVSPGLDASIYKYLVVGLWGDGNYFIQVNDGTWKDAIAVGDAPDTYDIVTIDLTAITSGTITGIRLGVGSVPTKKATYDFIEFHSADPEEPTAIVALNVLQREGEADIFESRWVEGVSDPFTKGHNIRLIATRDTNVEKLFAGVVEESNLLEGGNLRDVSGRCFQVKLQTATKNVTFSEDELSAAAIEFVEDLTEVTTDRVETPSPTINIRKKYYEVNLSDGLGELASLPSKQTPYDAWRWKLGYGQDLRLRSVLSANVRACTTSIVEGTNILSDVKLGSDLYGLYNKVVAYSGIVYLPYTDEYTEDFNDWTIEWVLNGNGEYLQNGAPAEGTNSIQLVGTLQGARIKNDLAAPINTTQMTRIILQVQAMTTFPYNQIRVYYGQDYDNSYYFDFKITPKTAFWNEIAIDLGGWSTRGSPTRTNVDYLAIEFILPAEYTGSVWWDAIHFVAPKIEATAVDGASPVDHDRVYFYKDAKINDQDKLQDFADGLLETLKAAANRIQIPVTGAPDLQRGRKVTVTSATYGLSGDYIIAEAEHVFNRDVGYTTTVLLDVGRYSLPYELKRTVEQELRLERRGTIPDTLYEAGSTPYAADLTGLIDLDRIPSPIIGKDIIVLDEGYVQIGDSEGAPRFEVWMPDGIQETLTMINLKPSAGNRASKLGLVPSGTVTTSGLHLLNSSDLENYGCLSIEIAADTLIYFHGESAGTGAAPTLAFVEFDWVPLFTDTFHLGTYGRNWNDIYAHSLGSVGAIVGLGTYTEHDITLFTNNIARWAVKPAGSIYPAVHDTYDLGHTALRLANIYTVKLFVTSTDLVENLNADLWDSKTWGDIYPDAGYPNALLKDGSRDIAGILQPDGDATRDLGTNARHFYEVYARSLSSSGATVSLGTYTEHGITLFSFNIARWQLTSAGNLVPATHNDYDLGHTALRIANIYAVKLFITSTDLVSNLNADLLDGQHRTLKINADHTHQSAGAEGGTLDVAAITAGILGVPRGGTGLGAYAQGGILYISAANTLSRLAPTAANFVLRSTATNALQFAALVVGDIPNLTTAKLTDVPAAAWATIFSTTFTIATVLSDHNKAAHDALALEHGDLTGLGDDDHAQYLLASGGRDIAGVLRPDGNATRDLGSTIRHFDAVHARDFTSSGAIVGIGTLTAHSITIYTNNVARWSVGSSGDIRPATHNDYDIGLSAVRVKNVYAVTLHGTLTAAEITSGQFSLSRMPRGTDGHVLTGTGAGSSPAYEAPAGALEIKRGSNTTDASGNRTVTFGIAFAATPKVFLQGVDAGAKGIVLDVVSKSASQFVVKSRKVTGITSGAGTSHRHSFSDSFNTSYVSAGTPAGSIGGPSGDYAFVASTGICDTKYAAGTSGGSPTEVFKAIISQGTFYAATYNHTHNFSGSAMGTHRHTGTASGNTGYESSHNHSVAAPVLAIGFDWLAIEA